MSVSKRCDASDSLGQRSAAERLNRYTVAVSAIGAITAAGSAAVVTSSGPGPVWTASVNGSNGFNPVTGVRTNSINLNWGDAILNNKVRVELLQGVLLNNSNRSVRRAILTAAGGSAVNSRLASGAVVGASIFTSAFQVARVESQAASAAASWNTVVKSDGWDFSPGVNSVRGYQAFRIRSGSSDFYYGYFDLEYSRTGVTPGSTFTMTIHGWAYESTLNQSITIGGAAAVPGGAGLAALAFGAAGLRGRRRGRN